jgi:hypothetical protein
MPELVRHTTRGTVLEEAVVLATATPVMTGDENTAMVTPTTDHMPRLRLFAIFRPVTFLAP